MAKPKRRGLGTGPLGLGEGSNVEDLLRRLPAAAEAGETLREVPPARIKRSPWQVRGELEPEALEALAESIRAHGVLEPLLVRQTDGGRYQLLAGDRRLQAAKRARLKAVPVRVLDVTDTAARAISLTENLAREDLTAWEEAQGLAALRDALEEEGAKVTRDRLAELTGRSGGAVSESLAIADALIPAVLERAGLDRQSLTKLPKTALLGASRAKDDAERALLLRLAAGAAAPGRAVRERGRRGRPRKPYTLTVKADRVTFQLRRPVEKLKPAEAKEVLKRLDPVLKALRKRAKGQ